MTESEKFNLLVKFQHEKVKVKITTVENAVYRCKLLGQCEDSDAWAYEFYSPDYQTKFFAFNCNFIAEIEELKEEEWLAAREGNND